MEEIGVDYALSEPTETIQQMDNNSTNKMSAEFIVAADACVEGTFPNICAFRYINVSTSIYTQVIY